MSNVSIKNIAEAIYESSQDKKDEDLSNILKNAVNLIHKKHLINKSREILLELDKIINKKEERAKAIISLKTEIDKNLQEEIEDFIKNRYKIKKVTLEFNIDKKLLGGMKIQVGDEIIDTTYKNKLKKLENYLITN